MGTLEQAFDFLISLAFDLAILLVLFRFLLQLVEADFYNPLTQFILKITQPIIKPFAYVVPTVKRWNLAALLVALLLEAVKIYINLEVQVGILAFIPGVLLWALGDLLYYFMHVFFFSIVLLAIISWFKPAGGNALLEILYKITMPLLRPARKLVPAVGGIDISPVPVLIILKLFSILFIEPIVTMGMQLAS
jgi:YggT family protein